MGNTQFSDLLRVPLSTIDQSSASIGEQSARMLIEAIGSQKNRRPKTIELEPALIVRESTLRRNGEVAKV